MRAIADLRQKTPNFRIVALSATPGKDIKQVQQVIKNLLISKLEACYLFLSEAQ